MKYREMLKARCLVLVLSQDISVLAPSSDFEETLKSIYMATRVNLRQFHVVDVHPLVAKFCFVGKTARRAG